MPIKVTIGLCVKNCAKVVKAAFDSISIQDYPHGFLKLVVVDDGSSDNTLSLAMKFVQETDIKTFVTSSGGKGLGATRQIAVDNAEGDYIVWVDDDFVLSKDFVRNQVEFMEKNPHVGAAKSISTQVIKTARNSISEYGPLINRSQDLKSLGTGGAIFRIKALESVGGFDIQIKGSGEDLDVSTRIKKSGWSLSTNNSALSYQRNQPATLVSLWKRHFWYGYGHHFIYHKYKDEGFLKEYFPPFAFYGGLKISYLVYRCGTNFRRTFAYAILRYFSTIAQFSGFIRANSDGYGHPNSN